MHNRILCERLQDQLRNKAGEKLVVFHMKRIFEASGIPDPENRKIILQVFQFFFDVQEIISNRDPIPCPCNAASEPKEFLGEQNRIWMKINNLKEENDIKASKLYFRTTGSNLKDVISKSQFHFGYVYQDDNM